MVREVRRKAAKESSRRFRVSVAAAGSVVATISLGVGRGGGVATKSGVDMECILV